MGDVSDELEAVQRKVAKEQTKLDKEAELLALAQERADRAGADVDTTAGKHEAAKKRRDEAEKTAARVRAEAKTARKAARAAAAEQQDALEALADQEKAHAKRGKKLAKAEAAHAAVSAEQQVEKAVARKAPVKKAPVKKAPVKKAPPRRAPAKKTTAKKAPAKRTTTKRT
jgi:hypothetical protein